MMDKKEELKNNIMLKMRYHLDSQELDLLGVVLTDELTKVEVDAPETELATVDNTNEYIMDLFMLKKAPKLSDKTVRQYTDAVRRLIDHCQKPLTRITSMDVEGWLNSIKSCNSNTSLNNQRRHLSAFFTWMRKSKIVTENPVESVEIYPEIQKPVDHMEAQEYEELKTGCIRKRDRAMMELLRSTAIRVGEAERLNVNDIDWRAGSVSVYGQKTRTYRTVYLDDIALKYLGEYIQERGCGINSRILCLCPIGVLAGSITACRMPGSVVHLRASQAEQRSNAGYIRISSEKPRLRISASAAVPYGMPDTIWDTKIGARLGSIMLQRIRSV